MSPSRPESNALRGILLDHAARGNDPVVDEARSA